MNIIDIMVSDLVKVSSQTTVANAIKLMQENNIHHLVVVSGDGTLLGIVSDRDLKWATKLPFAATDSGQAYAFADKFLVEQVMTPTPYCVSPHYSVAEVASLMVEHHVNAVPVIQDEILTGIVTSTDLLKILATQSL